MMQKVNMKKINVTLINEDLECLDLISKTVLDVITTGVKKLAQQVQNRTGLSDKYKDFIAGNLLVCAVHQCHSADQTFLNTVGNEYKQMLVQLKANNVSLQTEHRVH